MYCNNCGYQNPEEANYCLQDGYPLKKLTANITFIKEQIEYCANCGQKNEKQSSYCSNCGTFLLKKEKPQQQKVIPSISITEQLKRNGFKKGFTDSLFVNFKRGLIGAIISIVILAGISIIIQAVASEKINEFMFDEIGYSSMGYLDTNLIDFTEIMLISNLVNLKLGIYNEIYQIKYGLYLILLIPFISLFFGGFISAKRKPEMSVMDRISGAVSLGVIYALILTIIKMFTGVSESSYLGFTFNFSTSGTLFNGFYLGTLFSLFGFLFPMGGFKTTAHLRGNIKYGESVHQGIATVFRGTILTFVIILITLIIIGEPDNGEEFLEIGLSATLIGPYLWYFLNLIPINVSGIPFIGGGSISIFSLIKEGQLIDTINYYADDYAVVVYFIVLIPLILIFFSGRKIKQYSSGNALIDLGIFSLSYSLMMVFFAAITNINIQDSAVMEFSIIKTFIISFIFSAVIAFFGYISAHKKDSIVKQYTDINA